MFSFIYVAVVGVNVLACVLIGVVDNPFSYVRRWQRRALRGFALCWAFVNALVLLHV